MLVKEEPLEDDPLNTEMLVKIKGDPDEPEMARPSSAATGTGRRNHRYFYKKKPRQAQFAWMSPTSHAYTGLKFWEMLVSMLDLPLMHSKKQIQAENEVYEESRGPFLDLGFVKTCFL